MSQPGRARAVAGPAMLAMAWRRIHPLVVAVVVVALVALGGERRRAVGRPRPARHGFTVGSETEGRRAGSAWRSWRCRSRLPGPTSGRRLAGDVAAVVTLVAVPWIAGRTLRQRARAPRGPWRAPNAWSWSASASEQRPRRRSGCVSPELHDVVSHSISVIAIQAQAVRRRLPADAGARDRRPGSRRAAAREAMAEMRRLFGVLRERARSRPCRHSRGWASSTGCSTGCGPRG